MATTINALITTFPGLPNLTLPLPSTTKIHTLHAHLTTLLPPTPYRLLLSTTSGTPLSPSSPLPLSTLTHGHALLPLRLTLSLPGGKGGFGSQLRAAGGRMSSRKKRGQQENNDSCRNLDGRRMRTVKEAKALAAYLEIKPDMERQERERRRARALKVIEAAERKEEGGGRRFEDVKWLEETEEERERTRGAVERAMREGFTDRVFAEGSSGSGSDESEGEGEGEGSGEARKVVPRFAGWDEDDEFLSSDDEEEEDEEEEDEEEDKGMEDIQEEDEEEEEEYEGKGKGKGKA
ncbi:uncharacterized protein H6S33_011621 [Morchella sextelata]|uniref:uncharacterized protein n=1 Tax=Morchella sextelata TaxID=1174677 RepID=UPI001D057C9D|nr:uncharacterized protein H6S33_011621 [Morchella sextelata]KAH0611194.1 hypothetical protein H6S33_011621 [Morchella sextelata]